MATPAFDITTIKETSRHRLMAVKFNADTRPACVIKCEKSTTDATTRAHRSSIEREKRLIQHITATNNARHLIQILPIEIPSMASQPHYIMEYLQHDLYHYIYEKCHVRSVWFSQLCHALVTLEHYGISHGDIKPENVMLRERPGHSEQRPSLEAVLIDFEGAHTTPEVAEQLGIAASDRLGTPGYLAPEVVALDEGEQHQANKIGPHSDIWSLGSMALEALFNYTLQQPSASTSHRRLRWHIETVEQDLQQYGNGPILFPNEACFTFFSAMMHQDPRHRPSAENCANFFRDHAQTLDQHHEHWRHDKELPFLRC